MEILTMINASNFKVNINKLTEYRIRLIMQYIIYCYLKMLKENKKYSYSERGKISKEDYLKNGIVDDYLEKSYNKTFFKQNISDNLSVDITFHPEETMTYIDPETNQKSTDKIDIAIWENKLEAIWSNKTDNRIRFAVECKRIEKLLDTKKYIDDINKFCNRSFYCHNNRLPFEGQIAFIENSTITPILLKNNINDKLSTKSKLNEVFISDKYNGTYLSKHQRNASKQIFSIYHLLLDYSNVVID